MDLKKWSFFGSFDISIRVEKTIKIKKIRITADNLSFLNENIFFLKTIIPAIAISRIWIFSTAFHIKKVTGKNKNNIFSVLEFIKEAFLMFMIFKFV